MSLFKRLRWSDPQSEIEQDGQRFAAMKGAPQVLLGMSQLSDDEIQRVNETLDGLAGKGYRTLAVGRKQGDEPLQLLGLIPLYDPPREDSRQVTLICGTTASK